MQTEPLKGVVAPPRFVPRTNADHTAAEPNPEAPIIRENVRAIAVLLTRVLASPLNHRVVMVDSKGLSPTIWKSCVEISFKIPVLSKPPTINMKPVIKNIVSQSSRARTEETYVALPHR